MLTSLKNEHKKHLTFLLEQTPQVLQHFCQFAVDYLQKGPNLKVYGSVAQELRVEAEVVKSCVEALINLLLESRRLRLSDLAFRETVVSLGFQDERETLLTKLYQVEKSIVDRALTSVGLTLPFYHDLEWRFQVQLASRSLLRQLTPVFTLDLQLKNNNDNSKDPQHVLIQSDPKNLIKLARELESAMADGRTQHLRRVKRSVK